MTKTLAILAVAICLSVPVSAKNSSGAAEKDTPQEAAERVLDKLYATAGNRRVTKPALRLTAENRKVAAYNPSKNTIFLDEKAYQICRAFGRDSLAALAFVIGHELAHAFQSANRDGRQRTNFLAYDRAFPAATRFEKTADIHGIFNAALAGYAATPKIAPQLIEQIYTRYELVGKTLAAYPSLAERKTAADEVAAIAQNLLDVFDASTYALALGQHSVAAAGYEYVLQFYRGREVLNNLGLCHVRAAQDFWNPRTDNYLLPLEADWKSSLDRAASSRGQEAAADPLRRQKLERAAECFREALTNDPDYATAKINLVCTEILADRPAQALALWGEFFAPKNARRKKPVDEKAQLARAVALALQTGGTGEAQTVLTELTRSRNRTTALFARQNLLFMETGETDTSIGADIELPQSFVALAKSTSLGKTADLPTLPLNESNGIAFRHGQQGNTATFVFANPVGNLLSIVRFQNRMAAGVSVLPEGRTFDDDTFRNLLPARDGFYLRVPGEQVIVKADYRGNVLEIVRYFVH